MSRSEIVTTLALALSVATSLPLRAQNWVGNGEFDVDTAGWSRFDDLSVPDWLTVDHDVCGNDSGSARAMNDEGAVAIWYRTCVIGIVAGATYSADGFLRFPSGQGNTGSVRLEVLWRNSSADCEGDLLGGEESTWLESTNSDVWVHKALRNLTAPPGAASADVSVRLIKSEAGGSLIANFDGIHFVSGNGYLFGDGFESDTLCRWSEVVP